MIQSDGSTTGCSVQVALLREPEKLESQPYLLTFDCQAMRHDKGVCEHDCSSVRKSACKVDADHP